MVVVGRTVGGESANFHAVSRDSNRRDPRRDGTSTRHARDDKGHFYFHFIV